MVLIECHECQKSISTEAKACPHCGAKRKSKIIKAGKYFFIGLIILWGFLAILRGDPEAQRLAAMTPEQKVVEEKRLANVEKVKDDAREGRAAVDWCRRSLEENLKDPDSVKYSDQIETTPVSKGKDGLFVATIRVRAKNSFGGMMPAIYLCTVKHVGEDWTVQKLTEIPVR